MLIIAGGILLAILGLLVMVGLLQILVEYFFPIGLIVLIVLMLSYHSWDEIPSTMVFAFFAWVGIGWMVADYKKHRRVQKAKEIERKAEQEADRLAKAIVRAEQERVAK